MKKFFLRLFSAGIALCTVLSAAGCSSQSSAPSSASSADSSSSVSTGSDTIVYAMQSGWDSLNPFQAANSYSRLVQDKLFEKLAFVDGEFNVKPRAALEWSASEDGKVLTFQLADNITWADGTPCTASDWVFAAQLVTDPDYSNVAKSVYSRFEGVDDMGNEVSENSIAWEAVDENTLQMTLKEGVDIESFLGSYSQYLYALPTHLLSDIPVAELNDDAYWTAPVGNGPCVFESATTGNEIRFTANTSYYQGAPAFSQLIMRVVAADSMAAGLMSGDIDIVLNALSRDDSLACAENENVTCYTDSIAREFLMLAFNNNVFTDAAVRVALSQSIDRQTIIDALLGGDATISACPYVPAGDYYTEGLDSSVTFDAEAAKKALEDAGFDFSKTYTLGCAAGFRANVAAIMQQTWASIGVNIDIQTGDGSTILSGLKEGSFDMGLYGLGSATTDPSSISASQTASGGSNYSCISDTTFDELLDAYAVTLDKADRIEAAKAYQTYYAEQMPNTPVLIQFNYRLASSRLTGLDNIAAQGAYNDAVWEWGF